MLKNNNGAILTKMAKRSLYSNRRRSLILFVAVVLSAFMIFSVFTVGMTYFKMQRIQNIRLNGAEFDAILYGLTEEQRELCENNPDITAMGICAWTGYAIATEADDTLNIGFLWADDTYWNQMMAPAREWVKGEYPQAANDVMVTEAALENCGLEGLGLGDTFTMTYGDQFGEYTKEFHISGIWSGYGAQKVFYMSKAFYDQSGQDLNSVNSGRFYFDFQQKLMSQSEQDALIESMNLEKTQRMFFTVDFAYSVQIVIGVLGLALVTCLCAYLLIYNILYLSVSGNVRYYGLLQTVGMTGKQIHRLVQKQMVLIGSAGIAGGILLGSGVSFLLIPTVIKSLGIHTKEVGAIQISFHPLVFVLAVLMTGLAVWAGSRKPAKMAVSISPVEALGHRGMSGKHNTSQVGKGTIAWRLAKKQLTKDKKKSGLVILSLATSLSVFLCLITLIESQGARTIVSNYMDMDLTIQNDTMKKEDHTQWEQLIDENFLTEMREKEGVAEVYPMWCGEITVPWEPEFSDIWMREFYETWMTIPYEENLEEYQEHPENFGSMLIGINEMEFDYLNSTLETPIDKGAFLDGESCILYRNNLAFQISDFAGKHVTCAEYADAANTRTFEIAGLTDESYYVGALLGYPPTIIVSDHVLQEFVSEPFVYKAGIRYQEEYNEAIEARLLSQIQESPRARDFSYDSKIEEMKSVEKAQGNMLEVGIGIVLILALIGLLNYVNTVTGNIQSRQTELSILESVGMTEKQTCRMLIQEGLLYATGSLILTATIGTGVTYYLYQSMNYRNIPFAVPLLPVVVAVLLILLVCTAIPLVVYRYLVRSGTIVERIRRFE
ncbi:MAG: FtsX-like permease family protein [Oscillospiraceae bacterium]|jgi:putative ABC transport system permease protein